ncbi:hypothetical protein IH992_19380, partial [Candidatus Poribacteria bacterium]|nr:hypothetical protein [Candidatus Poribacteria bacterium]
MDSIFGTQIQYLLIGIILILAALLVYLLVVIRAYRKRQITQEGNTAASDAETSDVADKSQSEDTTKIVASTRYVELRMSFARAMKRLKANIPGRNYRYKLPWFIMAGEAESGKTTVLGSAGLNLPLGPPDEEEGGRRQRCKWWLFDKGVVLDIAGDYVMRMDGKTADDKGWQRVIRLLQKYRPERPIDGAILTIPCTDLIPSQLGDEWRAKTEDKAILLYNKLWEVHRTLGMCFPLYILVTKCDQVMGFGSFCKEIPERLRDDIFGWSNPYALGTAYTTDWVAEAFQNIHEHLYLTQTEVIADGIQVQDKDAFFLFPAEFQSMSEPLRIFLDSFFKQSAYHESFFFRGLYFCGDSQTDAMPSIASADDTASDDSSVPSTDSPAPPVSSIETEATPKAPFFLKRLFEQKIFPEYGLARPITKTFLSKNRTVVIIQAVLLIFVLVAGVGLGVDYYKLKTDLGGKYVAVLKKIKENLPVLSITELEVKNLNDGLISEDLRLQLKDHQMPLSLNATVRTLNGTVAEDKIWLITDTSQLYTVWKEEG